MALEDKLLDNFQHLRPDQRRLIVEFSELLLRQAAEQLLETSPVQEPVFSEKEREERLALIDEISASANPMAPVTSNRDHDKYLYGKP